MAFAVSPQHDSPDQNSFRAAFLSGLRTGGPRSVSPSSPADAGNRSPPQPYGHSQDSFGRLKANAAVFTPSGPQTPPGGHNGHQSDHSIDRLDEQLAAMRMQHALAAQKQSNYQYQDERAMAMARQQQQDQQQQLQIQLTMLQLQAQQQQQQHFAAQQQHQQQQQQQLMLAKLHAEYERLNSPPSPDNDAMHHMLGDHQHASAQEQRQAAQASIQNSLRYRQAQAQQQLYQSMLDGQQNAKQQQRVDAQALLFQQQQQHQQQQQFQQQLLYAQLQAQAQAQAQVVSTTPPVPLEQRSWRSSASHSRTQTPPSVRSGSPATQGQSTTSMASAHKKAANSASSWRKAKTPSIVVDDSASDTQGSVSDNDTPQTSEENAPSASYKTDKAHVARIHGLPQRAVPVSAAPRTRAFAEQGSRAASDSGAVQTIHPQRQPHGPPSDVRPTNFSARMSQRTRREALSKLNALVRSPRTVAAFSGIAAPAA